MRLVAQLDVLDRERRDARQILRQRQVACFVLVLSVGVADRERAQHAIAGTDGDDDQRAQLRIVQRARGPLGVEQARPFAVVEGREAPAGAAADDVEQGVQSRAPGHWRRGGLDGQSRIAQAKGESLQATAAALQVDECVASQFGEGCAGNGLHDARPIPISHDQPRARLEERHPAPRVSGVLCRVGPPKIELPLLRCPHPIGSAPIRFQGQSGLDGNATEHAQ